MTRDRILSRREAMMRTEVICDRCGNRIEAARSLIRLESGPLRDRLPTFDLCGRCQAALIGWLADEDAKPWDRRSEDGD